MTISRKAFRKATATLTQTQMKFVKDALGDGQDFPKFISDPRVNHAVDVLVCDYPPWEELSSGEQSLYFDEVTASFK